MKLLRHIPSFLKNKYFITGAAFAVWLLFFDRNDLFTQHERSRELEALEQSKEYYSGQIAKERRSLEELQNNPAAIEKYAREQYGMKRDNEDVFVVIKSGAAEPAQ